MKLLNFPYCFSCWCFAFFLVIATGNTISWENKKDLWNCVAGKNLVLVAVRISVPPCPKSGLHPEFNPAFLCLCFIYYLQHCFAQMLWKSPCIGEFFCKWAISLSKQDLGRSLKPPQGGTNASRIPWLSLPVGCSFSKHLEIIFACILSKNCSASKFSCYPAKWRVNKIGVNLDKSRL